jgi:hypothetical protein
VGRIEDLCRNFDRFASTSWPDHLAGAQRIWFAVYDRMDERRLRARLGIFEEATARSGHKWRLCDLTDVFADWMVDQDNRETYFEEPENLQTARDDILDFAADRLRHALAGSDRNTVVAALGVATLFGFARVSELMEKVKDSIVGRLLVFFPGEYEANNYRLLDARDGWNYLAVPITASERT